jgi:prefoldin subunit 5
MIRPDSTDSEIIAAELQVLDQMIAEVQSNRIQLELTERKLQIVRDALQNKQNPEQLSFDFGDTESATL